MASSLNGARRNDALDEFWGPQYAETVYALAVHQSDYDDCMDLIAEHGWPADYQLKAPTIMATRNGELIGCLGTREPVDDQTGQPVRVAGPLAIRDGAKRPVLAWRLIQRYEAALRARGIGRIHFDVDRDSHMEHAVLKAVPWLKPVRQDSERSYYVWDLDHVGMEMEELV